MTQPATEPIIALPPLSDESPFAVRCHGRTDQGKVRHRNEDHYLIAELLRTLWVRQTSLAQPQKQYSHNRGHVFLVADGMGGHNAGEVASALTITTIEDYVLHILKRYSHLQPSDEQTVLKEFQTALRDADTRIFAEAADHPEFSGMGTTLTMAFVTGRRLFVVHAGDSRCYLFHDGRLRQLTTDHTLAAEMVRRGVLKPEEVSQNQWRHVVTNVLGGNEVGVRVEMQKVELQAGDMVLLCSDGLTEMLSEERITAILTAEGEPQRACDRLITEANDAGGRDNVTAIVARFDVA